MASELDDLRAWAEELVRLASDRPEGSRARRLVERMDAARFLIAVVGEFKRGKSTLVNALLGEQVLPTGVLPLTAIATEVSFGNPGADVEFLDGRSEPVSKEQIASYVTETGNPGNERGVARLSIRGRWPIVEPGVVLVDTPGLASLYQHNTDAGLAALLDADGAVVVFSADAPLSEQERELLHLVHERRATTFFVLNRADHLNEDELGEVRRFVARTIEDILGEQVKLFATDARAALESGRSSDGRSGLEFDELVSELSRFVTEDLLMARLRSARNELARLGNSLSEAVAIERAVREIASDDLARIIVRFGSEAAVQWRGFEDDRALLARDCTELLESVTLRLAELAQGFPGTYFSTLGEIAASAPRSHIGDLLGDAVRGIVEEVFEDLRRALLAEVDDRWCNVANDFRSRVQSRVDGARRAAADLFSVPLPRIEIPEISEQRDRFSFLFLTIGSTTEPLVRAVRRLLPGRWARARALANARKELISELDKHVGRARWDISQRLEEARLDLEREMRSEIGAAIDAIVEAAERARIWQASALEDRARDDELSTNLDGLGADLAALGGQAQ